MSVYPKLIGRTGNQMFQIACALAYAKKHNMAYWVPKRSIAEHIWPAEFSHFPNEPLSGIPYYEYREPEHCYNEIPYHANICLNGFWQSEKYFKDYRQDILDAFQIPYKRLEGYVSIHVRRADYLQFADKHPPVTEQYLADAIMFMAEKGYSDFVVTSDDIPWCREAFKNIKGGSFSYSVRKSAIEDIALGSCCDHQICSNSTFSWWQYWLNQNPDKIGIMPETWFGPGNQNLSSVDIYPEGVIKM